MKIYRTIIQGRILESDSLRQLLARAVAEKRSLDLKARAISSLESPVTPGPKAVPVAAPFINAQKDPEQ